VSNEPRAFATVDLGTATVAVSLVGWLGGRWRFLGSTAGPTATGEDTLLERLRARLAAADPEIAELCGLDTPESIADLPKLAIRTTEPPVIAVAAATERVLAPYAAAAGGAGWRVVPVAIDGAGILGVASALADPAISAILAGTGSPPAADERGLVDELGSLISAATSRRPTLDVVLAGGLAEQRGTAGARIAHDRSGGTILAPDVAAAGGMTRIRELLDELRGAPDDGRRALAAATGTLAEVLHRRVELIEIGQSSGMRASAAWIPGGGEPDVVSAIVAAGALVPADDEEGAVDEVFGWLTASLDRLRVRDRLRELVLAPWGDVAGDGALLRIAAARAAVGRLLAATPEIDALPAPDLLVVSGGVWSVAPGPAVALAVADAVRRPGIRALGLDHARLLGPLGAIENPDERRPVMADLRDELLVPLGSVLMPAGFFGTKATGRLALHGSGGTVELDLAPGGLELVDLPPGEQAVVEAQFRDPVDLGRPGRRFAAEVTGGLGGLLVDLRDIPLRLPDRPDRRRDVLAAWQAAVWTGLEA
jgi:hypothetical protein